MKDIRRPGKRHTLLICLIHERTVRARDDLTEMFLKRMRCTHNWAQKKLLERQERQREVEEENAGRLRGGSQRGCYARGLS